MVGHRKWADIEHKGMKTVYALEPVTKSIFLAGPTPRDKETPSWRPYARDLILAHGFNGVVYIPERREYTENWEHDQQVMWEWEGLEASTVILFWVPRELEKMPAFTTNIEFGMYANSSKIVMGFPTGTPKMKYFETMALRYQIPIFNTLEDLTSFAVKRTQKPYDWVAS